MMSEFEMAYLMNDMMGTASTEFLNWVSVVTAFLAAGYIVSHRLDRWMIGAVLFVYSYTYLGMVRPMLVQIANIQGLAGKMETFAKAGKGLDWHAVSHGLLPQWLIDAEDITNVVTFALVYLVTVAFFFQQRRFNRKAEAGTWKPKT